MPAAAGAHGDGPLAAAALPGAAPGPAAALSRRVFIYSSSCQRAGQPSPVPSREDGELRRADGVSSAAESGHSGGRVVSEVRVKLLLLLERDFSYVFLKVHLLCVLVQPRSP